MDTHGRDADTRPDPDPSPDLSGERAEGLIHRTGTLATLAVGRMEADHDWFRDLSARERSGVAMVAQAGIGELLAWYDDGAREDRRHAEVFTSAPRSLMTAVTLAQALELTRSVMSTVEEAVDDLVPEAERPAFREAVLRYSRDAAFSAAAVYARAAEDRGGWDARLESLVVHAVLRGEADDTLSSRAAELGWDEVADVAVVVGRAPRAGSGSTETLARVRRTAAGLGLPLLAVVQGRRLVCVLGGAASPLEATTGILDHFGEGPVVVGPRVPHLYAAGRSARAALSGMDAASAWPGAPRPVAAEDLLAERALLGEVPARRQLTDRVYVPLRDHPAALLETVQSYLDHGMVLEATGRALFLHPNTVRYRLRKVADLVGLDPLRPRDAWILQVALALGRVIRTR